jgi:endonuclease/exonuclease/phosphatase family metal-dependent hydrolase
MQSPNNHRDERILRLATFNIQVGIGSKRLRHFFTHGWRYVMPHGQSLSNLDRIADILADYDIVAIQEADAGSFRTRYVNQAEYIAKKAGFPTWHSHIINEGGKIALHTNSLLTRLPLSDIRHHRLPASKHGRGALEAIIQVREKRIGVFITHLSLRRQNRERQIRYLIEQINRYDSAILMGDLNCEPGGSEFLQLFRHTRLRSSPVHPATFPSWRPTRCLDHILASDDLHLEGIQALPQLLSDHLPVAALLMIPDQEISS